MQRKTDYSDETQYGQHMDQQHKITKRQKWEELHLYGHLKQQTNEISLDKTLAWPRKGNLMRENKSKQRHKDQLCQRNNR